METVRPGRRFDEVEVSRSVMTNKARRPSEVESAGSGLLAIGSDEAIGTVVASVRNGLMLVAHAVELAFAANEVSRLSDHGTGVVAIDVGRRER